MSEALIPGKAAPEPVTTYLKDYDQPAFWVDTIDLHVDLYDDYALVKSVMKISRNKDSAAANNLILNGEELQLESVKLNNAILKENEYVVNASSLIIKNVPDQAVVEIIVRNFPQKNTALLGLYRSKNTYCTQCEAEGFRRITYYQDRPDVLAKFTTTITADKATHPMLLSNGNLTGSGDLENGRHWVKWVDPFKKPSYLFALVAGDFDLVQDEYVTKSGRKIDLRFYVDKGFANQVAHAVFSLKAAMRWDEDTYGREYDLDIYMIVAIGDFVMGAMENKGLNIFNTKYVLAKPATATDDDYIHILSVIGHEYFHNWSGNRVTCRDWFQLSLKEGLTIFRDQSFSEDCVSQAVMRIRDVSALRESQFPEDAGPLAHPVRPDSYIEINNFYTATVYNKGAEVLRMLRTLLGKELFRRGMDLYFDKFDGHAATIEDYVSVMEEVSGMNLQQFRLWYTQAGTPIVTVNDDYNPDNKRYTLTLTQHTSPTPGQPEKMPFHIPVQIGLLSKEGKDIHQQLLQLTEVSQVFIFNDINAKPVLSLFRQFSAPVKVKYEYSNADLIFLAEHDTDSFNRWEAIQKYLLNLMQDLINNFKLDRQLVLPQECIALFQFLLNDKSSDPFLLAEMLLLPSENYIGEQMDVVDVDAIHAVREFMLVTIASKLHAELLQCYQGTKIADRKSFNIQDIGKRQFKNRCLLYLLKIQENIELGISQFETSCKTLMADTMPALSGICNLDVPKRQQVLDQFYQTWKSEPLVVDKWLGVQAASIIPGALQRVKKLMTHEAFDIKNPNKVYSLIGAFGNRNIVQFHARNGEGYAFIREVVQKLDTLNPQVAGRMVKPLTNWRRYDKERQALMREQLEILAAKKLSPDLYELVTKSL